MFEFSDKNVGQVMTPRDRIFALKMDALSRLWKRFGGAADFERFRKECAGLREFAIFCALRSRLRKAWARLCCLEAATTAPG